MSPIEITTIRRKLSRMSDDLARLKDLEGITREAWERDPRTRAAGERWLQTSIEAAMDLNTSLLVGLGHAAPDSGHASFGDLANKTGVIPTDLASQLAPSAGLRNRLVHRYDDLEDELVLAGVRSAVELFPRYVEAVSAYVDGIEG